ncbi:MAG: metallophosphoesterase [Candidatus Hydrogenedentes bacterium]|nr:metallophosphoesterase [Candidatus Hydrogenedentota bacterium]
MSRRSVLFIAAASLICITAAARQPDGTLGLIRTPNSGVPAIVAPGGQFDVVVKQRAELRLVAGQDGPPLEIQWAGLPGGLARARCTVSADAAPGTYSVVAAAGELTDRNDRAVYVRDGFPDYYVVAHLTDTHVGSDRHTRPAADIFRDAIKAVNETEAAFVVISGDLTDNGQFEQFREFMAIMDESKLPTFVCPGNHDRDGLLYEQVFGPLTYGFLFGKDGYLVFDTKDYVTADDLDAQNANLEILRQQIKPCRWSIGVTHRYEPAQSLRSQLILFVDNPLDHLMFGHQHRARENDPKLVPWKTTPMTMTPATVDGFMRLYDISDKEVRPREPQRVAEVAPPEPAPAPDVEPSGAPEKPAEAK